MVGELSPNAERLTTPPASQPHGRARGMNICLVSQQYPPETASGGIGTQTFLKARGLVARGHSVDVISSTLDGAPTSYQDHGVTVHRLPYPTQDTEFCETSVLWVGYSWAVA